MTQLRRRLTGPDAERAKPPLFYSVAQVAEIFGMSTMTVYRAIAANEFPAVRVRGRLVVPARVLDAIVDAAVAEHGAVDVASLADRKPADSGA